ncbi:hypothetical protein K432DRAFT_430634 [Lepidopterella palustris CBS 459.81]|uniref:Ran-specific GTPase-activating protein n=1 Tax=Lepidopterella palustris CBS 459.81 TaxID=1314670 RepID=A0A8E2J8M5_9PEZI|nr:hypothetical protein K432DRAFT_430634 [Lepidopterella palustris CBS 459.81]
MEPAPIVSESAGIVTLCSKILACLCEFTDDVWEVDSSLRDFIGEVRGLSQVLDRISQSLKHNAFVATSDYKTLWASVDSSLQDCETTLVKLDQILRDFENGGSFILVLDEKRFKYPRFSSTRNAILAIKQDVHSHYMALQLTLETINICLALQSNCSQQDVVRQLASLKEHIKPAMDAVALQQQQANTADLPPSAIQDNGRISSNLYRLVLQARSCHSSISTALKVNRSFTWRGGMLSEPLSLEQYRSIGNLIPRKAIVVPQAAAEGQVEDSSASSESSVRTGPTSDSDAESDLCKKFENLGRRSLAEKDYGKAETYCLKAIHIAESSDTSSKVRATPLKAILAVIYCFEEKWEDAESLLQSVLDAKGHIDPLVMHCLHVVSMAYLDGGNKDHAKRLFPMAYLDESDLDSSDRLCRTALLWKENILGKCHPSYLQTVHLLARICDAKGDRAQAEGLRHLIPEVMLPNIHSRNSYLMENAIAHKLVPDESASKVAGDRQNFSNPSANRTPQHRDVSATKEEDISNERLKDLKEKEPVERPLKDQSPDINFALATRYSTRLRKTKTDPAQEDPEEIIFKMRGKLFKFGCELREWTLRGTGDVTLLRHKENQMTRLVMRQEKTYEICANHYILPDMRLLPNVGSDRSWVWSSAADISDGDPQALVLAIRFFNSDKANAFKEAFIKAQHDNELLFH